MARKQLGSTPSNSTDAVTKAYVDSGIATVANKTISGADNTVTGVSGMLVSCQIATQGSETYTISSGTVTQIAGTTINGYSPQVGDRVLVMTAPASSGGGTGYTTTIQPTNGVYRVTSNTTNISLTRAYDMSGTENPAGKMVWVQSGSWSAQTLWWVQFPVNSNTAFTWGTTNVSFVPVFGGNGNTTIYTLNSTNLYIQGSSYAAQLVQNSSAAAGQTLTLPAPTTDTIVSRTSTDTLTNKTLTNYTEGVVAIGTVTSSYTLDITNGTFLTATLTASTACTFTMPSVGAGKSFSLLLKQAAATGNGSATFTGVKWNAIGAPTITATAGKMDILNFFSDGASWYGSYVQGYTP